MSVANRITTEPLRPLNLNQKVVKWVCEHAGESISSICINYGFGSHQLHSYYRGKRTPFRSTLDRLCKATGFDVDDVISKVKKGGEDD